MTSSSPSIFILGATGFIGGDVLAHCLSAYPSSRVTVQYRRDEHEAILKKFSDNIDVVKCSLEDTDILAEQASKHDVVINCADCDDLPSTSALLKGLESSHKERIEARKGKSIYLHTSGTGEFIDLDVAMGELDPTVYDDANEDQIKAMPASRAHRDVTNKVIEAIERGKFLGYVILPSTIYGRGKGPVNTVSQQVPNTIHFALTRKEALFIEPGKNIWSNVSISSLSVLYLRLLELLLSSSAPPPPHPGHGFTHYISACSSYGPHTWSSLTKLIARELHALGRIPSPEARGVDRDAVKGLDGSASNSKGGALTGTTSVGKSSRAKSLVRWDGTEGEGQTLEQSLKRDLEDAVKKWDESQK